MNRSIRNIFTITALVLTFAPTLRCEDTQTHTVSTSKLQSAINYIKNIRTPLTQKEKLTQLIAQANVTEFETACDTVTSSDITPEEKSVLLQDLITTTQEVKQQLQTNLDDMADAQANKTMLAKGAAQTIGSAILFTTIASCLGILYQVVNITNKQEWDNYFDTSPLMELMKTPPFRYIVKPYFIITERILGAPSKNKDVLSGISSAIAGTALGAYLAKSGIQNCKNGWNYKAYIEQQIANIDEINAFIQTQLN